jgi:hypothetical protein
MEDQRIEARFGGRIGYASGGIGNLVDRQGYFLGSIGKAISGVFKGVTKAVKSVVKSDLGKAALAAAAIYFGSLIALAFKKGGKEELQKAMKELEKAHRGGSLGGN